MSEEIEGPSPEELLERWANTDHGRRQHRRWEINKSGAVKFFGTEENCTIRDISPGGACVEFSGSEKLSPSDKIVLQLEGLSPMVAEVCSIFEAQLGLKFLLDSDGHHGLAQWLTEEENARRQHHRDRLVAAATLHVGPLTFPYSIQNISVGGAQIEGEQFAPLNLGAEVALEFEGVGPINSTVCYNYELALGLTFNHDPETLKALVQWIKKPRPSGPEPANAEC
jgi:hypothetical protein